MEPFEIQRGKIKATVFKQGEHCIIEVRKDRGSVENWSDPKDRWAEIATVKAPVPEGVFRKAALLLQVLRIISQHQGA